MKRKLLLAIGSVTCALLSSASRSHARDFAQDLLRCGLIDEASARLRCFDELLPLARQSDEERAKESLRQAKADFGLSAVQRHAQEDDQTASVKPAEPDLRIEAKIASIQMPQYGAAVFALDNGQIWQTTSFGRLRTVPRVGQGVTIASGPLGGYRLSLEGQKTEVGVKRTK